MHRFFVSGENLRDNMAFFDPAETRHIERVLRLGAGAQVLVFDGSGMEYLVRLKEREGQGLMGEIIQVEARDAEPCLSPACT